MVEVGCFLATQRQFDEARSQFNRGHAMIEDLGQQILVAGSSQEPLTSRCWPVIRLPQSAACAPRARRWNGLASTASLLRVAVALLKRAGVQLDLAEVLELAGRRDEAMLAVAEALHLFEAKENVVAATRVRDRLATLGVSGP